MASPTLLERALKRREGQLSHECVRLFDGFGDGYDDLAIDKLGSLLLVHAFRQSDQIDPFLFELTQYATKLKASSIYLRHHFPEAAKSAALNVELIWGQAQEEAVISEHEIRYLIRPENNVNAGFFLDMSETRRTLRQGRAYGRVLNLFCFTGSLGICAWAAGAREVIQIDVSKAILAWAKENLILNQSVANGEMRFIKEDARVFLDRSIRRTNRGEERFDLIIIDPPSFGAGGKGAFSIKQEAHSLIKAALQLLAIGGDLIFSTNLREFDAAKVQAMVEEECAQCDLHFAAIHPLALPAGFINGTHSRAMRGIFGKSLAH